jgi:hypothetical protein
LMSEAERALTTELSESLFRISWSRKECVPQGINATGAD